MFLAVWMWVNFQCTIDSKQISPPRRRQIWRIASRRQTFPRNPRASKQGCLQWWIIFLIHDHNAGLILQESNNRSILQESNNDQLCSPKFIFDNILHLNQQSWNIYKRLIFIIFITIEEDGTERLYERNLESIQIGSIQDFWKYLYEFFRKDVDDIQNKN